MIRATVLAIALATVCTAQAPPALDGSWIGTLDFGFQKLRLVLHISNVGGSLTATADSPDQGAAGLPVSSITQQGDAVQFAFRTLAASFEGTLTGSEISGTFEQGGMKVPLVLRPLKPGELARKRTQIPKAPFPYAEQEVVFDNPAAAGVRLAGTLTIPPGKGPFPAVILITGSGPQTRNQEVAGHPTFFVIADALSRSGIAVLRYDDRGVGKSTGSFGAATTADFASDAEAAFEFLRKDKRFRRVGLLGHSEGGLVAPMVAAKNRKVSFLVLLAPPAVNGKEVLLAQKTAILQANGNLFPDLTADRDLYDAILSGRDVSTLLPATYPKAQRDFVLSPWTRFFLAFDPAPVLRKVKIPILALYGEKDLQVLHRQNAPPFRTATAANKRVDIEVLPSLNHLFQRSKTGLPTEYGANEETIAPVVLERLIGWVRALQ